MPSAYVIHIQRGSCAAHHSAVGTSHDYAYGVAILAIQNRGPDVTDAHEFVRVEFRQGPGDRIEDGGVEILNVGRATWGGPPVDENGEVLDRGVLATALIRDVAAYERRSHEWLMAQRPKTMHLRFSVTDARTRCGDESVGPGWRALSVEGAKVAAARNGPDFPVCEACTTSYIADGSPPSPIPGK
jgi:hypothetical protein